MSLVGKDQETITQAIKDLAENFEKVKIQEKKIENLIDENDNLKEENYNLNNKLKYERENNNDLEEDLKRKVGEFEELRKCVENNDHNVKKLDIAIKEREEEIDYLKEIQANQVGKEHVLEKEIESQRKVIEELKDKEFLEHDRTELENEIYQLTLEIKQLKKVNDDKVEQLENIEKEREFVQERLQNIEKQINNVNKVSLSEELSFAENFAQTFKCDFCDNKYESRSELRIHVRRVHLMATWKSKLLAIDRMNSEMKHKLYSDLFRIKELKLKGRESCSCRGFCSISHTKHNWNKSICDEILCKMDNLRSADVSVDGHQCETCEEIFPELSDFVKHIENYHKVADVIFLEN